MHAKYTLGDTQVRNKWLPIVLTLLARYIDAAHASDATLKLNCTEHVVADLLKPPTDTPVTEFDWVERFVIDIDTHTFTRIPSPEIAILDGTLRTKAQIDANIIKASYLQKSSAGSDKWDWVINRIEGTIHMELEQKLKTGDGRPLWEIRRSDGKCKSLFGNAF